MIQREKKGGSPESLIKPVDDKAFQKAKQAIESAAADRRRDKVQAGKLVTKKTKKRKKNIQSAPAPKRPRGRPQADRQSRGEKSEEVSEANSEEDDEEDYDAYEGEPGWVEFVTDKQVSRYQRENKTNLEQPLTQGELIVVAGHPELGDPQSFYVGAIITPPQGGTRFTLHFYNNPQQDLYGTYKPAWLDTHFDPPKEDYGKKTNLERYKPVESWGEMQWILARGFTLTRGKKLPPPIENTLRALIKGP